MTATSKSGKPQGLWAFINTLALVDSEPLSSIDDDQTPPWYETGKVFEIDERTYWYFLNLLPPRWMDGDWFAFGEGAGSFRLIWKIRDTYFLRELTQDETWTFCKLSRVALHEWENQHA